MSDAVTRALPKVNGFAIARPAVLPLLGFICVVLAVSLFFVWSRIEVVNLEYAISSYEGRLRKMDQELQRLRLEAASLRNPVRIEQVATSKLGLRLPTPPQVIMVD